MKRNKMFLKIKYKNNNNNTESNNNNSDVASNNQASTQRKISLNMCQPDRNK